MISVAFRDRELAGAWRPRSCSRVADRRQRIAQLVPEHRQELVLASIRCGQFLSLPLQLILQPLPFRHFTLQVFPSLMGLLGAGLRASLGGMDGSAAQGDGDADEWERPHRQLTP